MKAQEWTFGDKSAWPVRGEWDKEPDKVQWQDEATGLPCLAVRNRSHWCGYVGVQEGHPAFRKEYDAVDVDVHGGLTFASMCQPAHDKDYPERRVCHVAEPGEPEHLWWLGFDCAHSGDYTPPTGEYGRDPLFHRHDYEQYRTLAHVKSECRKLAEQLAGMTRQ